MLIHKQFPVFRTDCSKSTRWLSVLPLAVCIVLSDLTNLANGIVYQRESSSSRESYRSLGGRMSNSQETEIGRFSSSETGESSMPYFQRDEAKHYSEGGGLLFPNSNENLNYNDYNSQDVQQQEEKEEKVRWKGWNYLDTSKGWTPHEKTVSFQFLDDDGRYQHAPPSWPHDEYMLHFGHPYAPQGFGLRNASDTANNNGGGTGTSNAFTENSESNQAYEWQKLHARPSNNVQKGHFIGPGFYDYGSATPTHAYNPYYATHQSIIDSAAITPVITSSSASSSSDAGDGQIPNSASESTTHGKLFSGGYGGSPYDYYRRKRLRLKIHPGLLVAPIAGFAAYKAVSAIASKPLLFELGWVGNKPNIDVGGGWGWPSGVPQPRPPYPYYPQSIPNPYQPVLHPVHLPHGHGGQLVPILRPRKKPADSPTRSSWWNPFAALTPRFRNINKKDDRSGKESVNQDPQEESISWDDRTPRTATTDTDTSDDHKWFERP